MRKARKMNIIFINRGYRYENIELYFLDRIYSRCSLKDIIIFDKFWFKHWFFRILWDLHSGDNKKFLCF